MSAPLMPESVTMEELEQAQATPAAPKYEEIKLDGDSVPAELRGKSVTELLAMQSALADSLRLSESARKQAETNFQLAQQQPKTVEQPKEEPALTEEALAELYQTEPLKAIRYMQDQAARSLVSNLDSRLGTLFNSTAAQAEAQARTKYAKEFEALGPEISEMIKQIPNAKQVLTSSDHWDKLVSLVRGAPGNFEKMMQHYQGNAPANARQQQQELAGLTLSSAVRAPQAAAGAELDSLQKEIAGKLGLTDAEYKQWSKV